MSFVPHRALPIWNLHLSHLCHKFSLKPLIHHFAHTHLLVLLLLTHSHTSQAQLLPLLPPHVPLSQLPHFTLSLTCSGPPTLIQPCSHMLSNTGRPSRKVLGKPQCAGRGLWLAPSPAHTPPGLRQKGTKARVNAQVHRTY